MKPVRLVLITLTLLSGALQLPAAQAAPQDDPLSGVMWPDLRALYFADGRVEVDPRVKVIAPAQAESPHAVPVAVDARAFAPGEVEQIVLVADLNPFPIVLRYYPAAAKAYVAARIRVEQATPVRGVVRTRDGVWRVGTAIVDAAGGGCSAPPPRFAGQDWADHVGEVQARAWRSGVDGGARLRLRLRHPQDSGLVAGVPAYFLESLMVRDDQGGVLARLETFEALSEDPVLTLELTPSVAARRLVISGRDNQGGEIAAAAPLPTRTPTADAPTSQGDKP